ncbi:hypothetical protein OG2516_06327 [Oceanicola granulosus HTCC2516]|uniref:PH domain-containing protein n=1 Tax=Oceanicola granulosus (strain ATCC BAA-861 / DSM 15982 / KCTC 12143 / HTCC2516) TaxID=314256 RepID=Q2CD99_OCEGH|nr:hypothetical protein [Oceanicola granulosus]EAR50691.1 hypothetical protein OG2516_06327 [Oceanicola granulosus HTCC2516]
MSTDPVIARLEASPARRLFAIGVLYGLGGLLALLALLRPPGPGYVVMLLALAALVLWVGERLRQGSRTVVELTGDGLRERGGAVIAPLGEIVRVERGAFAFKPSNGFLVTLRTPAARAWVPGMWWRMGRRVGLGGVTPGGQAKAMADQLALLLAARERDG